MRECLCVCACVGLSGMGMLLGCCVLFTTTVGWTGAVGRGLPTIQLEYKWMCPIISQKMIKYKNKSNLALILG